MNFENSIDKNYEYLTSTDKLAVQTIQQNKKLFQTMNSTQAAQFLGISRTTLLRLVKKLELGSYAGFQLVLKQEEQPGEHQKLDMNEVISEYHYMIEKLQKYDYTQICNQIYQADMIYLYGTGNEQKTIIEEFKRIFLIMGKWCVDLFDYGEIEFAQKSFKETDLFVAVSLSGENKEVLRAVNLVQQTKMHTLSITRWKNNSLARMTENNLYVSTKTIHQNQKDSYEMIAAFYVMLDILSVRYLDTIRNHKQFKGQQIGEENHED